MTYNQIRQRLAVVYDAGEATAVARMLLEDMFGLSLADIMCGAVEQLTPADAARLEQAVQRLEQAEPVQYVLGHAQFCGHTFKVGQGVLVPRPETEALVSMVADAAPHGATVLDIGTGSGCIAISIKLARPDCHVSAYDISPAALQVARTNARQLNAEVDFCQCDALHLDQPTQPLWNVVVSNPPYVCQSESHDMAPNVLRYEPHEALFVPDDDAQLFFRAITHYAKHALHPGGQLLFEGNTALIADTACLMQQAGFSQAHVVADCFGMPRFAVAAMPHCH